MKRFLSFLFFIFLCGLCSAQFWPLMPVTDIPYSNSNYEHKRLFVKGTSIHAIRVGGLEVMDTATHQITYHWADHYPLQVVLPDTDAHHVYLKDNFIGKYNPLSQRYENINTTSLTNVEDIDVGANGNIWMVNWSTTVRNVGIYNTGNWQLYPTTISMNNILSITDTSAYIYSANNHEIYLFHQGTFDSLYTFPLNTYFADWDIDVNGDLWIAATYKLLHLSGNVVTVYDSTNTPVPGTDRFLHVVSGTDGHVWTCGNRNKIYEYTGTAWNTYTVAYSIENFALDQQNHPWIIYGFVLNYDYRYTRLYVLNGAGNYDISFPFMPYQDIHALGFSGVANDEGIFYFSIYNNFKIANYRDSAHYPNDYVNDGTCFEIFDGTPSNFYLSYGTHNGVYSLLGINNALLPSDTINYMYFKNGTEYICTDNGLVTFNQTLYSYYNTSNTPLPSNKITFALIATGTNNQSSLYLGTDNGIAIYSNAQWTVYDTSNIAVNNFYVSGIYPSTTWGDSATYITTLGSGLIKLYPSGGYDILNTSNGLFADDSLYYVIPAFLGKCGDFLMIGTNHHGVATYDYWNLNQFYYYDTTAGYPFTQSKHAVSAASGAVIVSTDAGLYWGLPCSAIEEHNSTYEPLSWYIENNNLMLTVPRMFKGAATIQLHDVLGKAIVEMNEAVYESQKISLNVENFSPGIYVATIRMGNKQALAKVVIY